MCSANVLRDRTSPTKRTGPQEMKPVVAHKAGCISSLHDFSFFLKKSQTCTHDQSAGICVAK